MKNSGLDLLFPLWGIPTDQLSQQMVTDGLKATITCVDPRKVPTHLAGHDYNQALFKALPDGVDPCGENGEFHTFAWGGPMFRYPISIHKGDVVERDGFVYADLTPVGHLA
jgi:diphthamide synthase (EF-2-diphthine--ammonia ligase)